MNTSFMPPLAAHVDARLPLPATHSASAQQAAWADDQTYLNKRLLKLIALARALSVLMGLLAVGLTMERGIAISPISFSIVVVALLLISWAGMLHAGYGGNPTQGQLMLEMALDIVLLTMVLSLVARDTPFDYLYMLPLVFAASAFTGWRVFVVGVMVAMGWTTIHALEGNSGAAYASAVSGHLAIAALVSYFIFAVARLARKHERILSKQRERVITALGDEAKGMMATRAAHALSTPLGTMAVIVADLREGRIPADERDAALDTLTRQIAACKLQLSGMLQSAGVDRGEGAYRADIFQILTEVREECLLHYPHGAVELIGAGAAGERRDTLMEISLFNAFAGIVKDLVREPPHVAEIATTSDAQGVVIEIRGGRGAPPARQGNPRRQERLAVLAAILERHSGALTTGPGERIVLRLPYADNATTES